MHTENKQSAVDLGEFLDRLYSHAMVLSRSVTEAEDLVQETCCAYRVTTTSSQGAKSW